ncbi:hypothetical protein LTR94_026174, partial [Friedmanniomyces endolithicus]
MEIIPKTKFSPDLFTDYSLQIKRAKLSDTLDHITHKYGKNTLSLGLCGRKEEHWQMNQERKSPNYLTEWNELFRILIPKRFVPPTPEEFKDKNMVYVFDSEDKFELTYDELVEII